MSEWRFLDANDPHAVPTLIEPRAADFEYDVVDHDDRFFIRHNGSGARDFMLSTTDITSPGWDSWTEFMAHEPGRPLRGLQSYREYLVVSCRRDGLPQVMVLRLSDGDVHYIAGVDEADFAMSPRPGWEFDTTSLRFSYTSMKTPASVYDYDMAGRQRVLRKQQEIPSGYDGDQYETRRIWATARDGTPVPISLLLRKDTPIDGSAPLYLYGYGSYGITMEASFSISAFSLVNRGFIYAIAHIRGGMEMGWDWYENGKLLNKRNTFNDFIDCAEHLVAQGYTSAGRIAAAGGSAGGMLMGAVVNARPDLFGCIVAHVPFVDVLNTMLDDSLPLTTMEYNEWGNPNDAEYYEYMRTYSPYDNRARAGLPAHAGYRRHQRPPRNLLGANQVGRQAPCHPYRRQPAAAENPHGFRPRRRLGPLRAHQGNCRGVRLRPARLRHVGLNPQRQPVIPAKAGIHSRRAVTNQ